MKAHSHRPLRTQERKVSARSKSTAALLAAIALLVSWLAVRHHPAPLGIDQTAFDLLALDNHGWVADAAPTVVDVAKVLLACFGLALACLLLFRRELRSAIAIALGLILGQSAAHLAKDAIQRPRPTHELVYAGGYSFPSTTSVLGVGLLFLMLAVGRSGPTSRRTYIAIVGVIITLALGLSFIVLRVHYLTDVIAGVALGVLMFLACELIVNVIGRRLPLLGG